MLGALEQGLIAALLLVLMTGMGASLTLGSFHAILRRPKPILIGIASQYGVMPALAYVLAIALALPAEAAIGLILIGCTPGGTTSNMFTYYARADVALSVSMTAFSTVMAVGMMPFCLWIYASGFVSTELQIPVGHVATTLAVLLIPLGIGMLARRRSIRVAQRIERAGAWSGALVLVLLISSSVLQNQAQFSLVGARLYVAAITLGLAGMAFGYLVARVWRLNLPQARAVAFETGIQNSPLALAIVTTSFASETQTQVMRVPLLYALFVMLGATAVTCLFRWRSEPGHATASAH